jgi:hypothetical protein
MERRWSMVAGWTVAVLLGAGCRFDESGIPPLAPQFEGCFEGGAETEIVLTLDVHDGLVNGLLVTGQNQNEQVMALAGEVESDTLAVLEGTLPGESTSREVIVLALPGDQLSVQVEDGPPSGPLSRCI